MTSVPERIVERRAERECWAQYNREKILDLQRGLDLIEAELVAIDMCIAAIEDAAKVPNAGAVEGERVLAATPQALGAENAPAGGAAALSGIEPKKPRAPRRDIRGMVLEYVEHYSGGNLDQDQIWRLLGVTPRAVASAIAYWQARGRLTIEDGVVRLRQEPGNSGESKAAVAHNASVEITGQGEVEVQDMGFMHPEMSRHALIEFLTHTPDSTMEEIREAGIDAAEVWRAEREGVVIAKAHGLYALVEPALRPVAE